MYLDRGQIILPRVYNYFLAVYNIKAVSKQRLSKQLVDWLYDWGLQYVVNKTAVL